MYVICIAVAADHKVLLRGETYSFMMAAELKLLSLAKILT